GLGKSMNTPTESAGAGSELWSGRESSASLRLSECRPVGRPTESAAREFQQERGCASGGNVEVKGASRGNFSDRADGIRVGCAILPNELDSASLIGQQTLV